MVCSIAERYTSAMCGIAGIVRLDGGTVDLGVLDRMTDRLAHRGPDGRGTFIAGSVGFGHRRLKILDLSESAHQPMVSENGQFVLVFNGEIYNFHELRKSLMGRGCTFTSTGDTEVLMQLYQREGAGCVQKLRGMFAFAILDRERNTVFIARDRIGKKPLKYFHTSSVFAFASELKALLTLPECPRDIDDEAIHHYCTMMYVPAPRTGITGIQKLAPGSCLTIDLTSTSMQSEKKYWQLSYEPKQKYSVQEWEEKIEATLTESVALRMMADVPVGAFLSGGIDSSAVVGLMARQSSSPIRTFSIGSPEETHNELPFAEITAKTFGTDHHPITLTPDIVHLLPELVATYDEPFADPSTIPTYLVAREARKHVTVALNGDGGDENFAGYVRYPILRFSRAWEKCPAFFHAMIGAGVKAWHQRKQTTLSYRCDRFQASMSLPWQQRYLRYLSFFTDEEKRRLYADGYGKEYPSTEAWYADLTASSRSRAHTLVDQMLAMDVDTYLPGDLLPKVDLGTMAHGLEARSPLLDTNLLELSASMPSSYKLRGNTGKWIFRKMLDGFIPSEILQKKKTGFRLPLDRWFRADLRSFVEGRLLDVSSPLLHYFDPIKLQIFLKDYYASSIDFSDHIWSLLWLDEWLRQYNHH